MDFHYRKMLNDSVETACKSYCDPIKNPDGSCPFDCIATCFPICYRPLYYALPPPDYADHSGSDAHPSRPLGLSVFLSVCLAILATAFFLFSCFTLYKFYRGRRNSSRSMRSSPQQPPLPLAASSLRRQEEAHLEFDQGPVVDHPLWYIRTVGLPPSVISAIPISKYKRGDRLVEGTDCSVCLSEFQDGETLRLLPKCGHAFHISCIDAWLGFHTNCPNCRARIVSSTENLQTPAQDLQNSVFNSGGLEEFQLGVSGNVSNRESERERESEILGVNLDVEDEEESRRNESFIEGNSGGSRDMEEGIQPMRRSVSMDALSASMINAAITNATSAESGNKDKNFAERNGSNVGVGNDQVCSSSTERCLQKETSLVKRSLSCSAKLFLSRYSKSRNPSLPS